MDRPSRGLALVVVSRIGALVVVRVGAPVVTVTVAAVGTPVEISIVQGKVTVGWVVRETVTG